MKETSSIVVLINIDHNFKLYLRPNYLLGMDVIATLWIVANLCCFLVTTIYAFRDYELCPSFLHDLFEWGKTRNKKEYSWWRSWFHVPNSWFMHFYLVGVAWTSLLLLILTNTCFGNSSEIPLLKYFIYLIMPSPNREPQVNCASVLLGLLLLLFQVSRRLYECLFVSIFSGRIHIVHYFVGIGFYLLVGATVASPMVKIHEGWCRSCEDLLHNIKPSHLLGIVVFIWASWHQSRCHKILAELRQPTRSVPRSNNYKIPYGDFFEYVSSPHYFAEILIYMAFNIVQGGDNRRLWLMLVFVIQNLTLGATVTQQWYLKKFENYPKNRYIILPFIY